MNPFSLMIIDSVPTRYKNCRWRSRCCGCFNYAAPSRWAVYYENHVCPRLYVSLQLYHRNDTSKLHQIFCACCLWPWLGPPLAVLQYIMFMYSQFVDGVILPKTIWAKAMQVERKYAVSDYQRAAPNWGGSVMFMNALFCVVVKNKRN